MSEYDIRFELSYAGADADHHEIDFYDIAQALGGFQRSLALTTHLVLNGEIITQAPALKGAKIYAFPAEEGSWKIDAKVVIAALTLANNNPIGHLLYSAYDYVISESLGFHVDYDKSLGELSEEHNKKKAALPVIQQSQLDSVVEKCGGAITEMHRPIYKTKTAEKAQLYVEINQHRTPLNSLFSMGSYHYITEEFVGDEVIVISGYVSSYNANTYKGRIYVPKEKRPVAFELDEHVRGQLDIQLIVESLKANALRTFVHTMQVEVFCKAQKVTTKLGVLKKYKVLAVSDKMFIE